ncbi:MAG TPA: ORF6N domain-containing protein [Sphingobacteriaceae bacterium]
MPAKQALSVISDNVVTRKIYEIRNRKIMIDSDLSEMYGVETRRLNEQVKRNSERFPEDFMFQLSENEFENLKSQNATSSWGGRRTLPYAFTEHGVLMLSSVLNSPQAVQVNIQIVRIFTRLREVISEHHELKLEIETIKKKLSSHDKNIEVVFSYLDELVENKEKPKTRKRIGYMPDEL